MKYYNSIKYYLLTMSIILAGSLFTACTDDIELDPNGNYDNIDGTYGALKNVTGARDQASITIFGSKTGTGQLYFELSEAATQDVSVQLKIDEEANSTSYQVYPAAQVSFENNGVLTVAAGSKKSNPLNITITSNGGVGNIYALPISAQVTIGGVAVSKNNQSYTYVIKPQNEIPDSDKGTGVKSVLYIEVNNENILNAGEYTMVSTGKPFFDVVNIFAANINYNQETKRVYVNCNENVTYILKNAEQFIRPLQAKGIKVVLTILGNHDEAGVANLSKEAAADFARELKTYVDVYGLDGIDFDDEYSLYNERYGGANQPPIESYVPSPGFVNPKGGGGSARLVYECRQLMPDKIISFYDFNAYVPSGTVEGKPVGELLDYSYYGLYGNWADRHGNITGLTKEKYNPISINLNFSASNGGYRMTDIQEARNQGFGIQMFYDLKTSTYNYKDLFNDVSNVIFNDEVEWTGVTYAKNSTTGVTNKPSYDAYLGKWSTTSNTSFYYQTPYWYYGNSMTTTLTIEEKVAGQSYTVTGWFLTNNELPLIANYNAESGRIEIPLPQKSIDTVSGEEWLYLPRYQYPYSVSYWMNYTTPFVGYSGIVNGSGIHLYPAPQPNYRMARTTSAVQLNPAGTVIEKVKGTALNQNIIWHPLNMSKISDE